MTPLQERLAADGWRLDLWHGTVGGQDRLWALGMLVPAVEVKVAERIVKATVPMENGADVVVFYDAEEPPGDEVWLHLMVDGHHARVDDTARIIASCCPGEGRATEGHDAELIGCQRTADWAAIEGATPSDLVRWLLRLSTYRVVR